MEESNGTELVNSVASSFPGSVEAKEENIANNSRPIILDSK
jgi:hypothetical protein